MLKQLKEDETVIVKRSDKCKGMVMMSKDDYVTKAQTIVSTYQPIHTNPTKKLDKTTGDLIKHTMKDKVPDKHIHAIIPRESRTAEFYGLPKTHKPNNPLRPIVSACGDPLDKLTWMLERIISQLLIFVPAHLTNTFDYLNRLKTRYPSGFPKGTIAFTVDVNNLYGNIPTAEAIESTIKMLKTHVNRIDLYGLTIPDIQSLLEHCLNNNYLRFGKKIYKQTEGIAMGSRIAPPLAILFMHTVESLILSADTPQPITYFRYIDDVIGLWTHGKESLDKYFKFINEFHPSIKFSIERSDQSENHQIPFLDTLLTVQPSGKYTTELYIKPMAAPIILSFNSAHPMQTKRSILHSQSLRAIRLGSNMAAKKRGLQKITKLFQSNGYPLALINRIQHSVLYKPHQHTSQNKSKAITYISLPFIDDHLSRRITTAAKSADLNISIAWKSGRTLANTLIRSSLDPPPCPRGHRKTCHTCNSGLEGRCHIKNTVYKITCTLCSHTYIGETTRQIRTRFMEHLGNARRKEQGKHLGEHTKEHHSDSQITDTTFTIEILHICKDAAECKIKESLEIRNQKPQINKQVFSWRLLPPVPYSSF